MKMACGGCGRFVKGDFYTTDQCRICWLHYHDPNYRALYDGTEPETDELPETQVAPDGVITRRGLPGTELKKLLATLGLEDVAGCSCGDRMRMMDAWGPKGCLDRKQEILGWLRESAKKTTTGAYLTAARKVLTSGLAFKLDPFNAVESLLDEAIRRAETSEIS